MNLFLNPSVNELHSLLQNAPDSKEVHDVVIDYDGEVLLDPQIVQPDLDLNKFKFWIQLAEFSKQTLQMGSKSVNYLFNNLLMAWNSDRDNLGSQRIKLA